MKPGPEYAPSSGNQVLSRLFAGVFGIFLGLSLLKFGRLGEFFMRKTLMFNGYGDQVAQLYSGMDLRKYY